MSLIVFDLDGTLIDSRRDLAESTNEMLGTYGAPALPIDRVAMLVGEGARKLVEAALHAAGLNPQEPEALARFMTIYDRRLLEHTRPYEGVLEMLESLAPDCDLAILTNKPERFTRRLLEAFDLARFFRHVIGGDAACARKPDPAGLNILMDVCHATPQSTWLVGDSMIDVETARAAGTKMCVVLYGFGQLRGELVLTEHEMTARLPQEIAAAIGIKEVKEVKL